MKINSVLISFWAILGFCLSFVSCNLVNEKPIDSIAASSYFQTYKDVDAAVMGIYNVLISDAYYGRLRTIMPELSAENIYQKNALFEFAHFSNHNIIASNILLPQIWAQMYRGIMRANNVIDVVPLMTNQNTEQLNLLSKSLGEAYFLRAMFYFDLVRMFGQVPLVIQANTSIDLAVVRIPKSPIEKVYAQIISDLLEAEKRLPETYALSLQTRARATKTAAKAFLAKVYLYNKNYDLCLSKSNEVLANTKLYNLVTLNQLYTTSENQECIFEVFFITEGLSSFLLPDVAPYDGQGLLPTTQKLKNLFEKNDQRLDYFLPKDNLFFAGKSKKTKTTSFDPIYCMRLAEIYLIKAEVLARTSGLNAQALELLNVIRKRANLTDKTLNNFADAPSLIEEIVLEKRKELMFETGEAWFDIIRAGLADKIFGINDPNMYLYPIPNAEIVNNPQLVQNAGY